MTAFHTEVFPTATRVALGKVAWSSGRINDRCGQGSFLLPVGLMGSQR